MKELSDEFQRFKRENSNTGIGAGPRNNNFNFVMGRTGQRQVIDANDQSFSGVQTKSNDHSFDQ